MNHYDLRFFEDFLNWKIPKRKNQTVEWLGKDIEELYLAGKKANPGLVTYSPGEFSYTFNSLGFRSDEFIPSDDTKVLYAGCSFTEGIGLPLEHVWSFQLNKMLFGDNAPFYNCAWSGMSIESISRFIIILIKRYKFNPKSVVFVLPSPYRSESIYFDNIENEWSSFNFIDNQPVEILMKFPENKMHAELVRKLYESKIHRTSADSIKTSIMALSILNLFLQTYGIKLMLGTWSQELFDNRDSISDNILNFDRQNFIDLHFPLHRNMTPDFKYNIARDYQHPGPSNNKQFAEYVFNNYSLI